MFVLFLVEVTAVSNSSAIYDVVKNWKPVKGECSITGFKTIPCSQECGLTSEKEMVCYNVDDFFLCRDIRAYYFYIWMPWLVLILLTLVGSLCCCRNVMPPAGNFLENVIVSALWACVINGLYCVISYGIEPSNMIMMILPVFLILASICFFWIASFPCCSRFDQRPHYVHNMMKAETLTREDLELLMCNLRQNPPIVKLDGKIVTPTITRIDGKRTVIMQVTPFEDVSPYVSWEERAVEAVLPDDWKLLYVEFETRFEYTEEMLDYINQKKTLMTNEMQECNPRSQIYVDLVDSIDGLIPYAVVSSGGEMPVLQKFVKTCCGGFLWGFLHFIGLGVVFEALYCSQIKKYKFKCHKYVSAQPDFHCPAYEADTMAPTIEARHFSK